MGHRTQITLTDEQYARLIALSEQTGTSLAELVRRALDRTYGAGGLEAITGSFRAWRDRDFDGAAYVERLRSGLQRRLARRGGAG